jgi:RNA polymerase sigma factor (TIGR02999 family)
MAEQHEPVTAILHAAGKGDARAVDRLAPLVYDELRRLARRLMADGPAGQTLQPTALVHEAYLRLVGVTDLHWESRRHFFAAAARAMRQILVARARRRQALKRGGDWVRVSFERVEPAQNDVAPGRILALDAALERLEGMDARKAQVVSLRYFAGITIEDTALALGVSVTTVKREWQFARAWLAREVALDE